MRIVKNPTAKKLAIDIIGPKRVVFASDNPAGDPISELAKIRMLELEAEVEERVLWKNIAEILGLNISRTGKGWL